MTINEAVVCLRQYVYYMQDAPDKENYKDLSQAIEKLLESHKTRGNTAVGFAMHILSGTIVKERMGKIGKEPEGEQYRPPEFDLLKAHLIHRGEGLFNEWLNEELGISLEERAETDKLAKEMRTLMDSFNEAFLKKFHEDLRFEEAIEKHLKKKEDDNKTQ